MARRQTTKRSATRRRAPKPAAFLSYVHSDDAHDDGWVSRFRRKLSGEVRAQTRVPFEIFQDRADIRWGQHWRERIDESLGATTFFVAILTPSFLESKECRRELREFLRHEKRQGRGRHAGGGGLTDRFSRGACP